MPWNIYFWRPGGAGERAWLGEVVCITLLGVAGRSGCSRWVRRASVQWSIFYGGNSGRVGAWGKARWRVRDCVVQPVGVGERKKQGEPVCSGVFISGGSAGRVCAWGKARWCAVEYFLLATGRGGWTRGARRGGVYRTVGGSRSERVRRRHACGSCA